MTVSDILTFLLVLFVAIPALLAAEFCFLIFWVLDRLPKGTVVHDNSLKEDHLSLTP